MKDQAFRVSVAMAVLLLAAGLFDHYRSNLSGQSIDFLTAWSVPNALSKERIPNIYSADGQKRLTDLVEADAARPGGSSIEKTALSTALSFSGGTLYTNGSPLLYTLMGVLSSGDFETDRRRYQLLSFASFLVAVGLLLFATRMPILPALLIVVFLLGHYLPLLPDVEDGNVNQIQLALIAVFVLLLARGRPLLAATVLGFTVLLKPNIGFIPVVVVLFALADREWRRLLHLGLGLTAGTTAAVLVSSVYFGDGLIWVRFVEHLPELLAWVYRLEAGNFGLAMLIFTLTGARMAWLLLMTVVGLTVAIAVLSRRRPLESATEADRRDVDLRTAFAATGIGVAVLLFASNLAWIHYYLLLIPAAIYLLRPDAGGGRDGRVAQVAALVALALLSKEAYYDVTANLTIAIVMNIAAAILMIAFVAEVWRERRQLHLRVAPKPPTKRRSR